MYGNPSIVSRKRSSIVIVRPASRRFASGGRPVFVIGINNLTNVPQNFRVADVQVVQSSGVYLIDSAAQRAVLSAAPFGPLPKDYGTNRITIQGIFKPTE